MKTLVKVLIWLLSIALVCSIAAFAVVGYWIPYDKAQTHFGETKPLIFEQQADGSVRIEWPKALDTDHYLFEITLPLQEGQEQPTVEFSRYLHNNFVTVDSLQGVKTITIHTVGEYLWPFSDTPHFRISENTISITDDFTPPSVQSYTWETDEVADTVSIELKLGGNAVARLYKLTEVMRPDYQWDIEGSSEILEFGDGKQFKLPPYGESYEFCFDAYRQTEDYIYYGRMTQPFTLIRDLFLGTDLTLTLTEEANDSVTLTWNETKGDYYLLQTRNSSKYKWKDLLMVAADGDRTYHIDGLTPNTYREFRVIARHNSDPEDAPNVAETEAVPLQVYSVLQYSTVWNITALDVYSDAQKTETLGKIKAGKAFCVLDIENGLFRVRYGTGYGYIDSNYCLINLPEFFGDLCKYDITNSYSSIYKFHTLPIPQVTDTIIIGYEEVQLSETEYLVPLLYPTALKLEKAAIKAREDKCYIKIYDSFRPQAATAMLYEVASEHCKLEVTQEDIDTLPEEEKPVIAEGQIYTYEQWVTDNGRFTLNFFLAKGISMHNRGLAIDMTLEKNDENLEMQSEMHDLTWHSEVALNNDNAKKMAKYMKDAGFAGLTSEWWHFQDNESRDTLKPPPLWDGITAQCWVATPNGWRYRRADGTFYRNCTRTIDGISCQFDKNGYLIENP